MKKFLIVSLISLLLATNVNAGTDGVNSLSKKNSNQVKDCFENINRVTFKFNQVLDGAIFKPVAKAYRVLPSSLRVGASNALDNLSNLVTIPNNILHESSKRLGLMQEGLLLIQQLVLLEYLMWLKKWISRNMKKKIMVKRLELWVLVRVVM